jgi:hypothetical protein
VAEQRGVADIQREIEQARTTLAGAIDEIAYRVNPQRVRENVVRTLREKAQTPQGRAVIAGAGGLVLFLVVRRLRKR